MKKFMALACAVVLAVASLAACGGNAVDPTEASSEVASEEASSEIVVETTEVETETETVAE